MKIKDVERSTGLSQSNIRFYEEEGLIIPVRLENNYRDYSKDDVERLLNIKKLRILGIPVAEIREVLEERQTLENCLQNRLEEIEREKQSLNEIAAVCKDAIERHVGFDSINEISFDEDSEECRDILQHILVNDTYEEVVDDAAFRRVAIGVYFAGIIISIAVVILSQTLMSSKPVDNSSIKAIYGAIVQTRSVFALASLIPSIAVFILSKGLRNGRKFCALSVIAAVFQPLMIQGLIGLGDMFNQFALTSYVDETDRVHPTAIAAGIIILICLAGVLIGASMERRISVGSLWVSLAESAVMTAAGLVVMMIACGAKDTAFLLAAGSVGWVYFFGTMMIWNLASSRDFRFNACFALRTATDMLNIMGVVFDLRGRYGSYNMRRTPEDDKKYYAG